MEETILALLAIDEKAKQIVSPIEEKIKNQENWVNQEIAVKEAVKEVQEKAREEKEQEQWNTKYEQEKKHIHQETKQEIVAIQKNYQENKEKTKQRLLTEITLGYYAKS